MKEDELRRGRKSGVAAPDVAVGSGAVSLSSWAKTATEEKEVEVSPTLLPLTKKLAALLAVAAANDANSASAV